MPLVSTACLKMYFEFFLAISVSALSHKLLKNVKRPQLPAAPLVHKTRQDMHSYHGGQDTFSTEEKLHFGMKISRAKKLLYWLVKIRKNTLTFSRESVFFEEWEAPYWPSF